MCLNHPCYENLNKFAVSKTARIIYGVLLVAAVILISIRLMQASDDLHSQRNARLEVIPNGLIKFDNAERSSFEPIVNKISEALKDYKEPKENRQRCENDFPQKGKTCDVSLKDYAPCSFENYYGYHRSSPCVFIKFKKVRDWIPEFYNKTDLPEQMPANLKHYINNDRHNNERAVWLSCEGETAADMENIGPINYIPSYGFPIFFFPWKGEENYLEPLIGLHFERPTRGVNIFIKCTAWAKNLQETVNFQILAD